MPSRALKSAEWMAENAYIAPGYHRLLTAGGLTLGLWGGRKIMDVVTARRKGGDEALAAKEVPEILRPLHGIMRYNPYSDEAGERWKFVIDRMVPVAVGAVSAYLGGKLYFHGKIPGMAPFSVASAAVRAQQQASKHSTEISDAMLRLRHADASRKWAATTFVEGSSMGMHMWGALWPFNNGMIAIGFQQGAGRNISIPFMHRLNRALGTHGSTSRYQFAAMRDATTWMQSNIQRYADPKHWVDDAQLLRKAKDGLQKFAQQTPAQEKRIADAYRHLITDGYREKRRFMATHPKANEAEIGAHLYRFISGDLNPKRGLLGSAHDHMLHRNGIDLSSVKLARDPWAFFSRLMGSRPKEIDVMKAHASYLNKTFGYRLNPEAWANQQLHMEPWKVGASYGGGGAALATALAAAGVAGHRLYRESNQTHKPHIYPVPKPGEVDDDVTLSADAQSLLYQNSDPRNKGRPHNLVDWVNGKPLDVAHWVSRALITPPSMHRFMNAAYLSVVLFGGMKFANILTGRNLAKLTSGKLMPSKSGAMIAESVLERSRVIAPLRPLHGLLGYTPGSAALRDHARQAAHYIIPVGFGVFGTYAGSAMYFKDRKAELATPKTLEDFADRAAFEQSQVYGAATALTSIFNTGSGIHLLPVFNYSSNLHNRYLLGSGQQVAMPGIGKWWSGNAGTTPWGVKLTLQYMANYLTYNTAPRPHEMPALVHSLIGKLYPTLNETKLLAAKQIILDRIYDVRDSYLIEGVIPPSKQEPLRSAMQKLCTGDGFEALLEEAALNPGKANIAANGASGTIANFLGKRAEVVKLSEQYRENYKARAAHKTQSPADYLRSLVDHGERTPSSNANDNKAGSFVEKVRSQPALSIVKH